MKQLLVAYWIAIVEDGETAEDVAAWIEKNVTPDPFGKESYLTDDVKFNDWPVSLAAGDVVVFNAPHTNRTVCYPGWARVPLTPTGDMPMSQEAREQMEQALTQEWEDTPPWTQRKKKSFTERLVRWYMRQTGE